MEIPAQAAAVHGITTAKARDLGVSPRLALDAFEMLLRCAGATVAHNAKFDIGIINTAVARAEITTCCPWPQSFCTMEAAAPIVAIPPTARMRAAGFNKPKPPRLEECIQHFFGETLEGAHDAMIDVRACARVFFHLRALKAQKAA